MQNFRPCRLALNCRREEDAYTRYLISIHYHFQNARKMTKFELRNVTQILPRIISKSHAYLQTMSITPLKFQKNRDKTVREIAHTRARYPISL